MIAYATACALGNMYSIFLQDMIYHSGTLCFLMVSSHSFVSPLPLRTLSVMANETSLERFLAMRKFMISSLTDMTSFRVAVLFFISSSALPRQTLVPCDNPEIYTSSLKVFGLVMASMPLVNFVPNSGTPSVPMGGL